MAVENGGSPFPAKIDGPDVSYEPAQSSFILNP
jgi:hypothetical protein